MSATMISVLVLAENDGPTLGRCLDAIERQVLGEDLEILLLDIGLAELTGEASMRRNVRLLTCKGLTPSAARNLALKTARGELLCFTDGSCIPRRDWIAKLITPLSRPSVIGVKGAYECAGNHWLARYIQLEHELKYGRLRRQNDIDFVDMYSAAYRRRALLANGGFDERFDRLEEQELSYRLAGRGYRMVFQPDALVRHQHTTALWSYVKWKVTIGYWKAQINRCYPERAVSDTYTPQTLRLQIGLLLAAALSALLSLLDRSFLIGLLISTVLFIATAMPFITFAWPTDRPVAVGAVPLLALRALALATGYARGLIWPPAQLAGKIQPIGGLNYLIKRLVDLIGSIVGLFFTAALTPFLAILIRMDSPGPVIFRQRRVGQSGRSFVMYKFRTMDADAQSRLGELLDGRHMEAPAFKLTDDPRVTRCGRFLRRWSLDELPQFWNVLRGDMSLVGPRPEEVQFVALYSDWHRRRLEVKPGMTGPMQVHGRADLSLDQRVRLEIEYIQEYTLWRDMKILLQTIPSLLRGQGAR